MKNNLVKPDMIVHNNEDSRVVYIKSGFKGRYIRLYESAYEELEASYVTKEEIPTPIEDTPKQST